MRSVTVESFGTLLLTRATGRAVADALAIEGDTMELNFRGVEAASPSFLDELVRSLFERGVRSVTIVGATDHIVRNLRRVGEEPERGGVRRARVELSAI